MHFKSSLWALGLVMGTSALCHAEPVRKIVPVDPTSFTSQVAGFSIWLPVKPSQETHVSSYDGSGGHGQFHAAYFQTQTQPVNYTVSASTFIYSQSSVLHATQRLETMERNFIASKYGGGIIQAREEVQSGALLGLNFKIMMPNARAMYKRFYSTPQFSYQITATGTQDALRKQNEQINRVFDSFRILSQ